MTQIELLKQIEALKKELRKQRKLSQKYHKGMLEEMEKAIKLEEKIDSLRFERAVCFIGWVLSIIAFVCAILWFNLK